MTAQFFEHVPGRIHVRFRHEGNEFDFLKMTIRARGASTTVTDVDDRMKPIERVRHVRQPQIIHCPISSVECPFRGIIAWLEAMALGVQECATEWGAEGPDVRLQWRANTLLVERSSDPGSDEQPEAPATVLEIRTDRKRVVHAFYTAFRRFVQGDQYDPVRYERLKLGEIIGLSALNGFTVEEVRGILLLLDAATVEFYLRLLKFERGIHVDEDASWVLPDESDLVEKLSSLVRPETIRKEAQAMANDYDELRYYFVPQSWDASDYVSRRAYLQKNFDWQSCSSHGAPIRELRSAIVENYIGWGFV